MQEVVRGASVDKSKAKMALGLDGYAGLPSAGRQVAPFL